MMPHSAKAALMPVCRRHRNANDGNDDDDDTDVVVDGVGLVFPAAVQDSSWQTIVTDREDVK